MKKILIITSFLLMLFASACQTKDECGPADDWSFDENKHWHACVIPTCTDYFDEEDHTFGKWSTNSEGIEVRKCNVCGYEEEKNSSSEVHEHNYSTKWNTNKNEHWHACNGCSVPGDKAEHSWIEVSKVEATYSNPGEIVKECSVCKYQTTETIPAIEHDCTYSDSWKSDSDNHWYECSLCYKKKDLDIHTITVKSDDGQTQNISCIVCGYNGTRPSTDTWDKVTVSKKLSGSGTESDPFQIHSGADLAYFKANAINMSGKYVKLMRNIDVNGSSVIVELFDGVLDGNNYTIKGLNILDYSDKGAAFIRTLDINGVIKNLTLEGSITGFTLVGAFVSVSNGNIINCVNKANIIAEWTVGGIAAQLKGSISSCVNYGNISNGKANCGGIVGDSFGYVSNSTNYGTIASTDWCVGGIVGKTTKEIENCLNYGFVSARGHVGGVVGESSSTVLECTNNGEVSITSVAFDYYGPVGGIIGKSTAEVTNCQNNGAVKAAWGEIGGIVGQAYGAITNCYNNATGRVIGGAWSIGGIVGVTYASITSCYNYAVISGTDGGVGGIVGEAPADKNIVISSSENHGAISGNWNIGGIVGYLRNNKVTDSSNTGRIAATGAVAGIAGSIAGGNITSCTNSGIVNAYNVFAGGILGMVASNSTGTVSNCSNSGVIESYNDGVGQITGGCEANATLTETNNTTNGSATNNVKMLSASSTKTNVLSINHRGYCFEAPENTLSAYRLSKEKGFDYVECDISFTKDGIPVLLHDDTIDRTSNGTGNIGNLTYEEASQYDYSYDSSHPELEAKFTAYRGEKLPTFDEFIVLCKEIELHPYIELKNGQYLTIEQIKVLVDIVKKYNMESNVSWISFDPGALAKVASLAPTARIGWVLSSLSNDVNAWNHIDKVNNFITGKNEVFIDMHYTNANESVVTSCIKKGIGLEVWCLDKGQESILSNIHPYVSGVSSNDMNAFDVLNNTIS